MQFADIADAPLRHQRPITEEEEKERPTWSRKGWSRWEEDEGYEADDDKDLD